MAVNHRIDPFTQENFLKALQYNKEKFSARPMIQTMPVSLIGQPANSPIRWGQCEDDLEIFTLDLDSTYGMPDPLIKGQDI